MNLEVPLIEQPLPQVSDSILTLISHADDERVIRAIEALRTDAMIIDLKHFDDVTILAEVISTVTIGSKKNPVEKTTTYNVAISPFGADCSCSDFVYRQTICKHIIFTVMESQRRANTEAHSTLPPPEGRERRLSEP